MITNFEQYAPHAARFDALRDASGHPRDGWQRLLPGFSALDSVGAGEARRERDRLMAELGAAPPPRPQSRTRSAQWQLDLLPYVVTSREWRDLEVGLAQRAELLRAIAADIYGPQRLLRSGLLPPDCVFGHPAFLLPCVGVDVPLDNRLPLYGAEIGRAPDGQFWVTQDWTQAPLGIGHALICRMVISRIFPSLFRDTGVHPVLPFLRSLRGMLMQLADGDVDQVVMLADASSAHSAAERILLARQLGIALVEGEDLQVSGGRCWLRGTERLQPVSTILRQLNDAHCDPLELDRSVAKGTAGLLQATRNRALTFVNPLGSGVLENPLLMTVLPKLCQTVLGEPLKLRSVDTWWCTHKAERDSVLANLQHLIVRRVDHRRGDAVHWGPKLSSKRRAALASQIMAMPEAFVAHTAVAHPTSPVMSDFGVAAHPVTLRTFAVGGANGYRVMSGGLARASEDPDGWRFSARHGGLCKDVWVLGTEPWHEAQTLPQFLPRQLNAVQLARPRVAENLFWLGRYAARSSLLVRLLGQCLQADVLANDAAGARATDKLATSLAMHTGLQTIGVPVAVEQSVRQVMFGTQAGALAHALDALGLASEPISDFFPPRAQELIQWLRSALVDQDQVGDHALPALLEGVETHANALAGQLRAELADDNAAAVIEMGMTLEACQSLLRILRGVLVSPNTDSELPQQLVEHVLSVFNVSQLAAGLPPESSHMFLIQTLLLDTGTPQSLRRRLMRLGQLLAAPATETDQDGLTGELADQLTKLGVTDAARLAGQPATGEALDSWLDSLQVWLREVSPRIEARFTPRRAKSQAQLVKTAQGMA